MRGTATQSHTPPFHHKPSAACTLPVPAYLPPTPRPSRLCTRLATVISRAHPSRAPLVPATRISRRRRRPPSSSSTAPLPRMPEAPGAARPRSPWSRLALAAAPHTLCHCTRCAPFAGAPLRPSPSHPRPSTSRPRTPLHTCKSVLLPTLCASLGVAWTWDCGARQSARSAFKGQARTRHDE
ncbi:hypothetical protein DFH09DRAFT_1464154 [Mycena vulgaris]|nr:hypothetical protein DFH09DRAFT_1464154 [Mycena vulgaris]